MPADLCPVWLLLVTIAGWLNRHQQHVIEYLMEENRVLKGQMKGRRLQLTDDQRRRLAAKGQRLGRRVLTRVATIVTPDTILRWHRQLIPGKWTFERKRPGRPGIMRELSSLMVRMASENPTWGYTRIQGARKNLFLANHRVLLCDRDSKWTDDFRRIVQSAGVRIVMTPVQAPNANAYAERFVRSIRAECLDRLILFGERRLFRAVDEFVAHYHRERNHQGLGNELIAPATAAAGGTQVRCRDRLGGLLRYYHRAA
jgi:transposase InsO family protein